MKGTIAVTFAAGHSVVLIDSHTSVIHHPSLTDGDIATAPSLSVCTVGGLISVAAELTSSETWILSIIIIE